MKHLFGLYIPRGTLASKLHYVWQHQDEINPIAVAVGIAGVGVLEGSKRINQRCCPSIALPEQLLLLLLAGSIAWYAVGGVEADYSTGWSHALKHLLDQIPLEFKRATYTEELEYEEGCRAEANAQPHCLANRLAPTFHIVETCNRMQLASMGKVAHSVPFVKGKTKMTLYKGEAALAARRAVASTLDSSLIHKLQKPRTITDKEDWTPMQKAAYKGRSKAVAVLAGLGADVNKADSNGCTPVFLAAQTGQNEPISVLSSLGADVNRAANNGETAVLAAVRKGHKSTVDLLISLGADAKQLNQKALDTAAEAGDVDGVDVKAGDVDGARAEMTVADGRPTRCRPARPTATSAPRSGSSTRWSHPRANAPRLAGAPPSPSSCRQF